ncbi:MAG: hypothetical protein U1F43_34885 [Myxococcota bacterium]
MARRLGDEAVLADVLFSAGGAFADYGPPAERAAIDAEAARLALSRRDRPRALRAFGRLAYDHVDLGDKAGFERALAGCRPSPSRPGSRACARRR